MTAEGNEVRNELRDQSLPRPPPNATHSSPHPPSHTATGQSAQTGSQPGHGLSRRTRGLAHGTSSNSLSPPTHLLPLLRSLPRLSSM